jgi:hypothetical protein
MRPALFLALLALCAAPCRADFAFTTLDVPGATTPATRAPSGVARCGSPPLDQAVVRRLHRDRGIALDLATGEQLRRHRVLEAFLGLVDGQGPHSLVLDCLNAP